MWGLHLSQFIVIFLGNGVHSADKVHRRDSESTTHSAQWIHSEGQCEGCWKTEQTHLKPISFPTSVIAIFQLVWCFREMENSVTEPGALLQSIKNYNVLTGESRTLTFTMKPPLETTCPPDFLDTWDQESISVSTTMDPSTGLKLLCGSICQHLDYLLTAPLTEEALRLCWSWSWTGGVEDPLMASLVEVCLQ